MNTLETILEFVLLGNLLAIIALSYGVVLELFEDHRQAATRVVNFTERREKLRAASRERRAS